MKRWLSVIVLLSLALSLSACSQDPYKSEAVAELAADANEYDLEIKEKMFVAQVNDVYLNPKEYAGKTIKLEGMFASFPYEPTGSTVRIVFRYGPGCCGNDGTVGFEVTWSEDVGIASPEENAWVEAIGVLEEYEELGATYLRLNLTSLHVKEQRGAEVVLQ